MELFPRRNMLQMNITPFFWKNIFYIEMLLYKNRDGGKQ
jgi:hypothetical protein